MNRSLGGHDENHQSYLAKHDENKFSKEVYHSSGVQLSRCARWFIFSLFFILNILMNMDHGTIPAATDDIRKDLNISDQNLGIFGSLVFVGNIIGIYIYLNKVH